MTTSQVLQEARAVIEAGWCQGASSDYGPNGEERYCVMGALTQVARRFDLALWQERAITRLLQRLIPGGFTHVQAFNDSRLTKKRDVLALFDRALTEVAK